ncbi:MAG: 7-cyano-7-deazaguanine synthase [Vicinamibacterales bacterium]
MVDNGSQDGQDTAVLCSAGLDSAVLLAHEAQRQFVTPVYVAVGLAWEAEEQRALGHLLRASVYERVRPAALLTFTMEDIYPPSHWARAGRPPGYDTPDEDVYLVGRNLVLLTKAAVFCAQSGLSRIVLGPLAGNPFPDATEAFFSAFSEAVSIGLDRPMAVATPFRHMHKAEVVRLGHALNVPLERSLSCMRPEGGLHCAACSKCRERHDAFVEAGISDPTRYAAPLPR